MRLKSRCKFHEVPKNAETAQMHPKYLMGQKLASSDQSTDSVQKCREVPKLENFHQALFWDNLHMKFKMLCSRQYGEILAHMNIN